MNRTRFSFLPFWRAALLPITMFAAEGDGGSASAPAGASPLATVDKAAMDAALAQQRAEFAAQLKEATGYDSLDALKEADMKAKGQLKELADSKAKESEALKAQLHATLINNAILAHAADAIDPSDVAAFLASKGTVDASGAVVIDGKAPAEAVKELLSKKPHLAKPQGVGGSGAPGASQSTKASETASDDLTGLALLQHARRSQ